MRRLEAGLEDPREVRKVLDGMEAGAVCYLYAPGDGSGGRVVDPEYPARWDAYVQKVPPRGKKGRRGRGRDRPFRIHGRAGTKNPRAAAQRYEPADLDRAAEFIGAVGPREVVIVP